MRGIFGKEPKIARVVGFRKMTFCINEKKIGKLNNRYVMVSNRNM